MERRPKVDVWPIQLWNRPSVLPVPLLAPDPDVALDLGAAVASVYERGAYARQIDYQQAPPPSSLHNAEAEWLAVLPVRNSQSMLARARASTTSDQVIDTACMSQLYEETAGITSSPNNLRDFNACSWGIPPKRWLAQNTS
jgi:Protein of unknown function (DUF4058)